MTDGIIVILVTVYSIWVIYAGSADLSTFTFGVILLVSGILFYKLVKNAGINLLRNTILFGRCF